MKVRNWDSLNSLIDICMIKAFIIALIVGVFMFVKGVANYEVCKKHYPNRTYNCMISSKYSLPARYVLDFKNAHYKDGYVCMPVEVRK